MKRELCRKPKIAGPLFLGQSLSVLLYWVLVGTLVKALELLKAYKKILLREFPVLKIYDPLLPNVWPIGSVVCSCGVVRQAAAGLWVLATWICAEFLGETGAALWGKQNICIYLTKEACSLKCIINHLDMDHPQLFPSQSQAPCSNFRFRLVHGDSSISDGHSLTLRLLRFTMCFPSDSSSAVGFNVRFETRNKCLKSD